MRDRDDLPDLCLRAMADRLRRPIERFSTPGRRHERSVLTNAAAVARTADRRGPRGRPRRPPRDRGAGRRPNGETYRSYIGTAQSGRAIAARGGTGNLGLAIAVRDSLRLDGGDALPDAPVGKRGDRDGLSGPGLRSGAGDGGPWHRSPSTPPSACERTRHRARCHNFAPAHRNPFSPGPHAEKDSRL